VGAKTDFDLDGVKGCADPDCGGICDPLCDGLGVCTGTRPRCGDGVCDPVFESWLNCPDCTAPAAVCGNVQCETGESAVSCPGDCS
jgi:hypothetical protein